MPQDRLLQLSPVELMDEEMNLLPVSARFLAIVLRWRAHPTEPTRLNLRQIKARVFPLDPAVTLDSLEVDVLALEDAGFLTTFADADGRERYRLGRFDRSPDPAPASDVGAAHREHIATVGRESEREGARESAPPLPPTAPPPASGLPPLHRPIPQRFCPQHRPTGAGGSRCVQCRDHRMDFEAFQLERMYGVPTPDEPPRPPVDEQPPLFRRPRFRPSDGSDDPDDPDDPWNIPLPF